MKNNNFFPGPKGIFTRARVSRERDVPATVRLNYQQGDFPDTHIGVSVTSILFEVFFYCKSLNNVAFLCEIIKESARKLLEVEEKSIYLANC